MKTEYEYMRFVKMGDTGKTTRWFILNKETMAQLGEIKWYSSWRCYCFFAMPNCVFNKGCLTDITDFIAQLQGLRKKQRGVDIKDLIAGTDAIEA
jgi:hypothetical protein